MKVTTMSSRVENARTKVRNAPAAWHNKQWVPDFLDKEILIQSRACPGLYRLRGGQVVWCQIPFMHWNHTTKRVLKPIFWPVVTVTDMAPALTEKEVLWKAQHYARLISKGEGWLSFSVSFATLEDAETFRNEWLALHTLERGDYATKEDDYYTTFPNYPI